MRFYGLADYRLSQSELGEVIEFYASQEKAEGVLREALSDEPEWVGQLGLEMVELPVSLQ